MMWPICCGPATWRIEVKDFPAFVVVNHEGKDFYAELAAQRPASLVQLDG